MSKYTQFAKCLRNANAPLVLSIGAVLLLALAALVGARGSTQAQSLDMETAKYEITFTGLFDGDALSAGTAVPVNAGFSVMVGGAHNSSVAYWSDGGAASSGLESLAEDGATTDFREEINASVNAGNGKRSFVYTGTDLPPTGDRAILFKTTRDFPLVTLAAKVEPSPDWFVGVSGLDLRPNGEWSGRSPLTSIRGMPVPKVEASSATASRPRIRKGGFRACATRTGSPMVPSPGLRSRSGSRPRSRE